VKTKLLVLMLFAAGTVFAALSIGVRIGAPPPVRVLRVQPRSPGPDYTWIGGYWYPVGSRYRWHDGYWTRPAYNGARWVEPRHDGERFHEGYWDGDHGQIEHNHTWDRDGNHHRDYDRDQDRR
jgi:hypothetical protein